MRIKRIGTVDTFRKYREGLSALLPAYLKKSKCTDSPEQILRHIRQECNSPLFFCCVVEEDGTLIGFLTALVVVDYAGRRLVIDHMYCRKNKLVPKLFDLVRGKLKADSVLFVTYRPPEAWIRLTEKYDHDHRLELAGWLLRTVKKEPEQEE